MYFCVSFHFQYCVGDSCILALTVTVMLHKQQISEV